MKCEKVEFCLKKNITKKKFTDEIAKLYRDFWTKQKGFVRGEVLKNENGWIHLMYWESDEDISKCSKKLKAESLAKDFYNIIDEETVQIKMLDVIQLY